MKRSLSLTECQYHLPKSNQQIISLRLKKIYCNYFCGSFRVKNRQMNLRDPIDLDLDLMQRSGFRPTRSLPRWALRICLHLTCIKTGTVRAKEERHF